MSERKTEIVDEEIEDDGFDYFQPEYEEADENDEDNEREYCD